ncbi:MAG TPA: DUF2000 domain-containing protein [Actinophytocola sp.]|uniref:DUF2000 domain-containing protein n=1 Tax=Actinophytocola sp. TaxID=1872138 RepID=UPI002DDCD634|nr:DUF2000 domain-containing protein [Actinophytocola sp.]HEV2781238.1 DUF2000 domain-containing protein [Actinophytocola sp.]
MRFDTKIVVAVREDLEIWRRLNVTAFLASGIAAGVGEVTGKPFEDASGNRYLQMFRQPVVVCTGDAEALGRTHRRALDRAMATVIYPEALFATDNEDDNQAAVRGLPADRLGLAGLAVYGSRNAVDKVCKGLRLHP